MDRVALVRGRSETTHRILRGGRYQMTLALPYLSIYGELMTNDEIKQLLEPLILYAIQSSRSSGVWGIVSEKLNLLVPNLKLSKKIYVLHLDVIEELYLSKKIRKLYLPYGTSEFFWEIVNEGE